MLANTIAIDSMISRPLKPILLGTLQDVAAYARNNGKPAFTKEIVTWYEQPHQTTRYRLERLAEHGLIRFQGPQRDIAFVTEAGFNVATTGRLVPPLAKFNGGAHAGSRGCEVDGELEWVKCLADLFTINDWEADYFLPVVGDCMAGSRGGRVPIVPGAVVLFHACSRWSRPQNGRPTHVEVDLGDGQCEALLRDYYFNEATGLVTLVPRNPEYEALELADELVDPRGWSNEWKQPDFINQGEHDEFLRQIRNTAKLMLPMRRIAEGLTSG